MKTQQYDLSECVPLDRRKQVEDCIIACSANVLKNVMVSLPSKQGVCRGYRVNIEDPHFTGKILLALGPGNGRVDIQTRGPAHIDVRIWRGGTLLIGEGTTVNGARIVIDDADVFVGDDGLWSDEVLIQSNDQHGIVDSTSGEVLNSGRRRIEIGAHVWLGRRTTVMPNVTIGAGSILAAGAVLTKDVPKNCIFAGIPARCIKTGVTWSRSTNGMNDLEKQYLE
jgi:acetyltransferase-like isoleucine patch superfamily enzyme